MNEMREAFEKAFPDLIFYKRPDGEYVNPRTVGYWKGWQAASSRCAPEQYQSEETLENQRAQAVKRADFAVAEVARLKELLSRSADELHEVWLASTYENPPRNPEFWEKLEKEIRAALTVGETRKEEAQ